MSGKSDAEILDAAMDGRLDDDGNINDTQDSQSAAAASDLPDGDQDEAGDQKAVAATPKTESESKDAPDAAAQLDEGGDPVGAPIRSKSGGYTIDYSKLESARAERDQLRERVRELEEQQQRNLAQAQADAQARSDAGQQQTKADKELAAAEQAMADGADVSLFGDFSESDIAKGIAELNRRAVEALRTEMQASVAPIQAQSSLSAQEAHIKAITDAHADAFEVVESKEFDAWRAGLPAFARAGVDEAINTGSAQEVIDVLTEFRRSVAPTGDKPKPQQQTTPAAAAPEAPKARVPVSLSEVPGSAPVDETQQVMAAADNPNALLDRMTEMNGDQLDALMDRI